jgi:hypothetical protein
VHRVTQKSACSIYYCTAAGSVDEAMWKLLEKKLAVTTSIVSGTRSTGFGAAEHEADELPMPAAADAAGASSRRDIRSFLQPRSQGSPACNNAPAGGVGAAAAKRPRDGAPDEIEDSDDGGDVAMPTWGLTQAPAGGAGPSSEGVCAPPAAGGASAAADAPGERRRKEGKKRVRVAVRVEDLEEAAEPAAVGTELRPPCAYAAGCYRQGNPQHRREFSHPADAASTIVMDPDSGLMI